VEVGGVGTLVVLTRGGFLKRGGKRNGLVGAGVAGRKGGDACVALVPRVSAFLLLPGRHSASEARLMGVEYSRVDPGGQP
jgi:hypothetical protein